MRFGDRIKNLREVNGYSQKELSKMINKSENTLSLLENNKIESDFKTLISLSEIFNVSIDYLLGISLNKSVHTSIFPEITNIHKEILSATNGFSNDDFANLMYFVDSIIKKQS